MGDPAVTTAPSDSAELVVRDLSVRVVVVPLNRPLATKIGHFDRWPLVLIDLRTDDGLTGRSYLAPYLTRAAAAIVPLLRDLGEELRGVAVAPTTIAAVTRSLLNVAGQQGLAPSAVAGVDIAVWDVLAQRAGLPLARLLGGTMGPVPAYNSNGLGLLPAGQLPDEAVSLLGEGGFQALKARVGRARDTDDVDVSPAMAWRGMTTPSGTTRSTFDPSRGERSAVSGSGDQRLPRHPGGKVFMTEVVPEVCSCSALRQAARHVTRFYDDALRPAGLGLNQYSILAKLDRFGPQTIHELSLLLVMDRSTVGHLLRPLEKRALVHVRVSEQDRRSRVVALTAEGQAVMGRARPLWAEAERRFETLVGPEAAHSLRVALKEITMTPLTVN